MAKDKVLLKKFKKVMRMSNHISKQDAAKFMKISHDALLEKLFEWGDDLSFKIESDEIVISDFSDFTGQVDVLIEDCQGKESLARARLRVSIPTMR